MVPYGKKTHPNNRALTISRMISLDKKFDKQPDLHTKYVETMNRYIEDRHTTKIDINQRNDNLNKKVNYTPKHVFTNINKPGKIRIVFKCQKTTLSENLLKRSDLLNNLFRPGKFCVLADIEKMFPQVLVDKSDRDIQMNVHLFGRVDSSCCCIWALHKTALMLSKL